MESLFKLFVFPRSLKLFEMVKILSESVLMREFKSGVKKEACKKGKYNIERTLR